MFLKRFSLLIIISLLLLVPTLASAQDTPQPIRELAIAELNRQVPNIGRPQAWQHILISANESNLGCSLTGPGASLNGLIEVYVVTLTYPSGTYTYHVSSDATRIVACGSSLTTIVTPPPANSNTGVAGPGTGITTGPTTGQTFTSTTCPANFAGYLYPRLFVGATGRVETGTNINNIIRQNYGRSSQPTGAEMPPGTTFPVIGGPECTGAQLNEAIVWWQVTYNGVTGWTAESLNGEYFLELAGGTPLNTGAVITLPAARQPLNAGNVARVAELGQMSFINDTPFADVGNNGILVVGSRTAALIYSSTGSSQISPTSQIQLQPADYYENINALGTRVVTSDYTASETNPATQLIYWDTATGAEVVRTEVFATGDLRVAQPSPDGSKMLVAYTQTGGSYLTRMFDANTRFMTDLVGAGDAINAAFSPDGRTLATYGLTADSVILWDAATLTQLRTLNVDAIPAVNSGANGAAELTFSPNGQILAVGGENGLVQLWEVATGTLKSTLTVYQPSQGTVLTIAFSPDGNLLAAGGGFISQAAPSTNNQIAIFDLTNNSRLSTLTAHTNIVTRVSFSPDGALLVSSAADGTVRVWGVR